MKQEVIMTIALMATFTTAALSNKIRIIKESSPVHPEPIPITYRLAYQSTGWLNHA